MQAHFDVTHIVFHYAARGNLVAVSQSLSQVQSKFSVEVAVIHNSTCLLSRAGHYYLDFNRATSLLNTMYYTQATNEVNCLALL